MQQRTFPLVNTCARSQHLYHYNGLAPTPVDIVKKSQVGKVKSEITFLLLTVPRLVMIYRCRTPHAWPTSPEGPLIMQIMLTIQ